MGCHRLTCIDDFTPILRVLKGGGCKPKKSFTHKYQWDYIHDPENMVGIFEDDSEGESQLWSDPVCTQKFIEQFRWAYVNNKKLEYKADGYPWFGHFAKSMMLNGTIFEKITVEVRQDLSFVPTKTDYEQVYSRAIFNYGTVLSITTLDKFAETQEYLFPTKADWDKQVDGLIKKVNTATSRIKFLEELAILPYQEYYRFTATERVTALNFIMQGSITEDIISCRNDEKIVINLIKYTPDDQLEKLFYGLQQTNLMQTLCSKIQDAFGEENYTEFIGILTSKFYTAKQDELTSIGSDVDTYSRNKSENDKLQVWFGWRKEWRNDEYNIRYRKSYENNKIVFKQAIGYWVNADRWYERPALDPFDIVIVEFEDVPTQICKSCLSDGEILPMPAFLFEWICNEYTNKEITEYTNATVALASFAVGVGHYLKVSLSLKQ